MCCRFCTTILRLILIINLELKKVKSATTNIYPALIIPSVVSRPKRVIVCPPASPTNCRAVFLSKPRALIMNVSFRLTRPQNPDAWVIVCAFSQLSALVFPTRRGESRISKTPKCSGTGEFEEVGWRKLVAGRWPSAQFRSYSTDLWPPPPFPPPLPHFFFVFEAEVEGSEGDGSRARGWKGRVGKRLKWEDESKNEKTGRGFKKI